MILSQRLRSDYQIAARRVRLTLLSASAASIKAGFRQDQLHDAAGCWTRECVVVERGNDKTGNPRIDATTDLIIDVIKEVMERIGPGSGPLYGTRLHSEVARTVRSLDLPGIDRAGVEQNFVDGEVSLYGSSGSIRTDIIKIRGRSPSDDVLAI